MAFFVCWSFFKDLSEAFDLNQANFLIFFDKLDQLIEYGSSFFFHSNEMQRVENPDFKASSSEQANDGKSPEALWWAIDFASHPFFNCPIFINFPSWPDFFIFFWRSGVFCVKQKHG